MMHSRMAVAFPTFSCLVAQSALGAGLVDLHPALTFQSVTAQRVETSGGPLHYDAVVSRFVFEDDDDALIASFYTYSYVARDTADAQARPIAYFFNGGPGSSSVWLHMGFAAPVRIPDDAAIPGAGAVVDALVPNPHTLLADADLVFIDPIGTGFSRASGGGRDSDYWGVDEDAESVAALVRAHLRENDRETSPVILVGESYGALRAAAMLDDLLSRNPAVDVRAVALISPALSTAIIASRGETASLVSRLPTYAALAWHHDMLGEDEVGLWAHVEQAVALANGDYRRAIESPEELSAGEIDDLVRRLHTLTGVDPDKIRRNQLRISERLFADAAQEETGGRLGGLDGRFVGGRGGAGEIPYNSFGTAIRTHLAQTWRIDTQGRYTIMNSRANARWRGRDGREHVFHGEMGTLSMLEAAQRVKPNLAVFVASGLYDQVTPFAAARTLLSESGLDRDRLSVFEYPSGHMVYLEEASHRALSAHLREFIQGCVSTPGPS